MTTTALEVYKQAYELHYEKNEVEKACRLYRQIVQSFPLSKEASYALLQLEQIGQPPIETVTAAQRVPAWIIAMLTVQTLVVATLVVAGVLYQRSISESVDRVQKSAVATLTYVNGNSADAQEQMMSLFRTSPSDPTITQLLSSMYAANGSFNQASAVIATYLAAGGDTLIATRQQNRVSFLQYKANQSKAQPVVQSK